MLAIGKTEQKLLLTQPEDVWTIERLRELWKRVLITKVSLDSECSAHAPVGDKLLLTLPPNQRRARSVAHTRHLLRVSRSVWRCNLLHLLRVSRLM